MARTQYTFTFTNAQPGADVGFNFPAYADASTPDADGPAVVLDSTNSVSVWADSDYLIAHTVDGRGVQIVGVATYAYPTQTIDAGVAGSSPFGTGGSVPIPGGPGDALKVVRATPAGDGLELAISPIGNKADYSNSSPSIVVATGGLPHYITAADLPDLALEPDPGALPAMETDGSVVFPDGALLLATAFVSGDYGVAPLVGSDVFVVALGGNAIEILADTANTILPTADGATTSFSVATSALVAIPPGGQVGPMYAMNIDPNELTLTFIEFVIRRAA